MSKLTFNQETKVKWISIMQEHQDVDRLIQGAWFEGGKGCFFGCAMETNINPLSKAIDEMHLPEWIVYLAERIFEGLPKEDALLFPVQLLSAIPIGCNIDCVKHKLAIKRLTNLIKDSNGEQVNKAINMVIEYHKEPNNIAAWSAAWSAARSAAGLAAGLAARSAAGLAVWSAVDSAIWAVRSAADSAADSVVDLTAESVAWSAESAESAARAAANSAAAWQQERDWLIELLKKVNRKKD